MAHESLEEEILELQSELLTPINHKAFNGILRKIDLLKSSYVADNFLQIGDQAPDFSLPNSVKKMINLKEELKKGKLILSFFRGGWCPYCYLELRMLQKNLNEFKKLGANVLAVTSERIDYCLNTVERNGLKFEVVSDKGNKVAEDYQLVYKSDTDVDLWDELGLQQAISSGDISYELPVPATFIIDEWGTVKYIYADPDYRKRPDADELLEALMKL